MPDCDYCGASFEGEDDYLAHLDAEHGDDLSPIDRRRVEQRTEDDETDRRPLVLGVVLLLGAVVVGYTIFVAGGDAGDGNGDAIETQSLPENGDQALLEDVEQHPSEGRDHVSRDTDVSYETTPPTSGSHYDGVVEAGFYTEAQPAGDLVHTLEHGAIVIYYDPDALSPEARESLERFAGAHTGTWRSVVVVPNPYDEVESPYVLTAWRHSLRMDEYDAEVVRAFLAEYIGRGPENPVR